MSFYYYIPDTFYDRTHGFSNIAYIMNDEYEFLKERIKKKLDDAYNVVITKRRSMVVLLNGFLKALLQILTKTINDYSFGLATKKNKKQKRLLDSRIVVLRKVEKDVKPFVTFSTPTFNNPISLAELIFNFFIEIEQGNTIINKDLNEW